MTLRSTLLLCLSLCMLGVAAYALSETKPEDTTTKPEVQNQDTLIIYSSRNEELIRPVLDLFTKQTGTKTVLHTAKAGVLIEKIKALKDKGQADVLITVDAGNLWAARQAQILQPIFSDTLTSTVPFPYRDSDGYWWGVSLRARTIFYNPTLVKASELSSYEDLADPRWKKKLCLRTSQKVYNQSLVAMMLYEHGQDKTHNIVKGWVANLAAPVFSSDTKLIEAIAAKQCAVGIANSYYFGRLLKKQPDLQARVFWPNQKEDSAEGVHVNLSGAAVLKNAPHPALAKSFVEFLLSKESQKIFAALNMEYPISSQSKELQDPILQSWGTFKMSAMPLEEAGRKQQAAIKVMDHAGYL